MLVSALHRKLVHSAQETAKKNTCVDAKKVDNLTVYVEERKEIHQENKKQVSERVMSGDSFAVIQLTTSNCTRIIFH